MVVNTVTWEMFGRFALEKLKIVQCLFLTAPKAFAITGAKIGPLISVKPDRVVRYRVVTSLFAMKTIV